MIQIDMPMPEKCSDCIFCDDNCSCVASDYNGFGINVGCAYRTGGRDIRCPLKEQEAVVRCKDCIHQDCKDGQCPVQSTGDPFYDSKPDDDWFCADGKAKEGGQK